MKTAIQTTLDGITKFQKAAQARNRFLKRKGAMEVPRAQLVPGQRYFEYSSLSGTSHALLPVEFVQHLGSGVVELKLVLTDGTLAPATSRTGNPLYTKL